MPHPNSTADGPRFSALVIGCDFYLPNDTPDGSYPSLNGCVRDATRVRDFLARHVAPGGPIVFLTSTADPQRTGRPVEPPASRPSYENIVRGFQSLTAAARPGDHVYVHYSGHGGRCPTIVPAVKGTAGLDEVLVPFDIGRTDARYVRDVEISKLLADMTAKQLVVTVVLDCCHSGGATRAVRRDDQVGIRGVAFVDRTPRPTDSLVGTPTELAAAMPAADATRGTGDARGMTPADAEQSKCVVLAACRPFELAREFPFDGGPSQGALTYWLLRLAATGTAGLTFRTVFDQVVKRIHDQFPAQTPMLFGNPDRLLFAGDVLTTPPAVPVTAAAGTSVTLGAGAAALVQTGATYAVYPADATDLTAAAERLALVRVTAVTPTAATAEQTDAVPGARPVQPGDRAVPIGTPVNLVRRVDVVRPDGRPPTAADAALHGVTAALAGRTWVEPGTPADFTVTTDAAGTIFRICDASDVPLAIRPDLPTAAAESARKIVDRLVHLARFQAVQTLDNPDPASPLRGRVEVRLLETPAGFQKGDTTVGLPAYPTGGVPRVPPGRWVVLSVTNRSTKPINFVVLDLSSDWSVSVAHPDDHSLTVPPGERFDLPLQAWLPDGQADGSEVLKVVATVDPVPAFDLLTLPPLDVPIPVVDRGPTRSGGALAAVLDAAAAEHPTRAVNTGSRVSAAGWAVVQTRLEIGRALVAETSFP